MASGKSNYLAQKLLDHEFNLATYTFPATGYLALYTTSPGATDAGVELSGNNYSRVAVPLNSTNWSRTAQTISNVLQQLFPVLSGTTGTVVALGVRDAASGGNLLWFADLSAPYQKAFVANDQPVYPAGSITITES